MSTTMSSPTPTKVLTLWHYKSPVSAYVHEDGTVEEDDVFGELGPEERQTCRMFHIGEATDLFSLPGTHNIAAVFASPNEKFVILTKQQKSSNWYWNLAPSEQVTQAEFLTFFANYETVTFFEG